MALLSLAHLPATARLQTLMIFKPDTLIRWYRKGFRLYWTWESRRGQGGRPPIDSGTRELIRLMSRNNIGWGAPRIHGELKMLGIQVSESTVAKYMIRHRNPPSQTWRTFLDNHVPDIVSVDFFTVLTATFRILYVFVILHHERREIVHFNAMYHPAAELAAQQIVEAFPFDTAPRYCYHAPVTTRLLPRALIRDRDSIYGARFRSRVNSLGIEEVLAAPRSPWQNLYVERIIGSIRRECLNHVIIFDERHLRRQLKPYITCYQEANSFVSYYGPGGPWEARICLPFPE